MFKNRVNRKRGGKNYLILAIIVLISISVGCTAVRSGRVLSRTTSNDAGLLVTTREFHLISNNGNISRYDGQLEYEIKRDNPWLMEDETIEIINIDGHYLPTNEVWDKIELEPGPHNITFRINAAYTTYDQGYHTYVRKPINTTLTQSINMERKRVYLLNAGISFTRPKHLYFTGDIQISTFSWTPFSAIYRTPHTYDKTTGIMTHPTVSKRSYKVK